LMLEFYTEFVNSNFLTAPVFITVFWWGPRIVLDVCVVFLCFVCLLPVCPMFPMSLDCSFLGSLRFSLTFLYNSTTVSKDFQDPISQHNLTLFQFSRLAFKIKKKTKYKKKTNFQRISKHRDEHRCSRRVSSFSFL
jgi:hypothetical protein